MTDVALKLRTPAGWLDGSVRLFSLLALLTLLPAAFVLWFMNDALSRETASSRQRVLEAYRGQLRLVRSRLDPIWRAQAVGLNDAGRTHEHTAAERFGQVMARGLADGMLLLAPDGALMYPDRGSHHQNVVEDIEQALARAGRSESNVRAAVIDMIAARLNDYSLAMPADARLRLMHSLRALSPNVKLPTQAALQLSLELASAERPTPVPDVVRQTAVPDVWALTSDDRRLVALYRTGRLESLMHDFLHQVAPSGITFLATPPDMRADSEAIAAGPWLPGWQLSFMQLDSALDEARDTGQKTLYVSVALAGVAVIGIVGAIAAGSMRRQLKVARLKTDLVAAASHELRTPLASMRVLVDGLLDDAELDPVKTREYLNLLAREHARLSRVIEHFLTFSRLDHKRHRFTFAPLEPAAIASAAVDAVRDRVPSGCEIRLDVAPDLPALVADAEALGTALVNLLDNALKYTPEEKRITMRVGRDDDAHVVFTVEDNGIGIPIHEQRRIFRRFYRVDQRLSRESSGVGLGLSIVELIVRAHRGTVTVRSEAGVGSTFILRLPSADEGVAA